MRLSSGAPADSPANPRRGATPCPADRRRARAADVLIAVLVAAGWCAFARYATGGRRAFFYDTFRDAAYAENIAAGRIDRDPCIAGLPYWYAPGNPLLVAAVHRVSGVPIADVYASSVYWFNGLTPVLLFVLARRTFGRAVGAASVPVWLMGSFWWLTHAAAPMPAIQGVALNLLGLLGWHGTVWASSASTGRWRAGRAALTGVLLAGSTWHHPLCGVVLAATIALHALWLAFSSMTRGVARGAVRDGSADCRAVAAPAVIVAGVAGGLTLPLIVHLARLPVVNSEPLRFVPNEMLDARFALQGHAPLVGLLGIAGAAWILRRVPQAVWIVAYAVVGFVGQAAGYLGRFLALPVPYLLPHEFQYHAQLAWALCAAAGMAAFARWCGARATHTGRLWLPAGRAGAFVCLLSLGPALPQVPHARDRFVDLDRLAGAYGELAAWIRGHTGIETTFLCEPELAHFVVCGLTGRKTVALPAGHTNPAADARARQADAATLLHTAEEVEFARLARAYGVEYVLIAAPPGGSSGDTAPVAARRFATWRTLAPVFAAPDGSAQVYALAH